VAEVPVSGWLGELPLYVQRHGHPRWRARHVRFPIDRAAADQWMLCMTTALSQQVSDDELRQRLIVALTNVADHMRNPSD